MATPLLLLPSLAAEPPTSLPQAPSTVIVPLDGSALAEAALPFAEDLAQRLTAEVMLARAVPFPGAIVDEQAPPTGEVEARAYLGSLMGNLRSAGIPVQSRTFDGPPGGVYSQPGEPDTAQPRGAHHPRPLSAGALVRRQCGGGGRPSGQRSCPRHPPSTQSALCRQSFCLLAQAPLFAALDQEDREHLGETARIRAYQPGELIVREGDTATGCFIIASGQVEVVKGEASAHPTVLTTLGAGEFFGEMAVIDDHPRSASVWALEATECVAIGRAEFLETIQRRPQIAVQMLPGSGPPPAQRRCQSLGVRDVAMEYRQLGRAGVRVSIIGLGTNRFGTDQLPQEEVSKIIDAALDLGINFIDAANTYVRGRCEETLGHALRGRRERFILATKAALPIGDGPNDRGASRYHLLPRSRTACVACGRITSTCIRASLG